MLKKHTVLLGTAGILICAMFALIMHHTPVALASSPGLPQNASWTQLNFSHYIVHLVDDPTNAQILYAGTLDGIYKSVDEGRDWSESDSGIVVANGTTNQIQALAVAPSNPNVLYAGTSADTFKGTTGRTYKSTDGGANWTDVTSNLLQSSPYDPVDIAVDPFDPNIAYLAFYGNCMGVWKTSDGGSSWVHTPTNCDTYRVVIDPRDHNTVFVGANVLYKSPDEGVTWSTPGSADLSNIGAVRGIGIDPTNDNTLYLGTERTSIFKSSDGGNSWTQETNGPAGQVAATVLLDADDPQTIYAGTLCPALGCSAIGMFRSSDGGNTWSAFNAGDYPQNLQALLIPTQDHAHLFAGTQTGLYVYGASLTTPTPTSTPTVAPTITSSSAASTAMRQPFTFTVTSTGSPTPSLSESGPLPTGIVFTDNGDGTATLAGEAAIGTNGTYPLTLMASNGVGSPATQAFTLTSTSSPAITGPTSDTETFGVPFSFTITTDGYPAPTLTKTGTLPAGVTFVDNGNGTATLSGTPGSSAVGNYALTLKAKNSVAVVTQSFTLTIVKTPVFKSVTIPVGHVGSVYTLTLKTSAYGTPTISGTPQVGSGGAYAVSVTATNAQGSATKAFTLKINEGPTITSAANATATIGQPFSFAVTATGYPAPSISKGGTLPKGLTYQASTHTISGTPAAGTQGTYLFLFTAKNSTGTVQQVFTLTIQ